MYYSSSLLYGIVFGDTAYYSNAQRLAVTECIHKVMKAVAFFVRPYQGPKNQYERQLY